MQTSPLLLPRTRDMWGIYSTGDGCCRRAVIVI